MKQNKIELVLLVITLIAIALSISSVNASALGLAGNQTNPSHYPNPHPSVQAPANFPWDKLPGGHVPPPFTAPTTYPGPSQP